MCIYIYSKHGEIPQLQEAPFIIKPFLEFLLVCTTHYDKNDPHPWLAVGDLAKQ